MAKTPERRALANVAVLPTDAVRAPRLDPLPRLRKRPHRQAPVDALLEYERHRLSNALLDASAAAGLSSLSVPYQIRRRRNGNHLGPEGSRGLPGECRVSKRPPPFTASLERLKSAEGAPLRMP